MRAWQIQLLIAAVFTSLAAGQAQSEEQMFHFSYAVGVQDMQEITTVIRAISDVQQAIADTDQKSLAIRGTPTQIALAGWLFKGLDVPLDQPPPSSADYPGTAPGDDVVRVFYLTHTDTVQNLAEIATLVRSIGNIRRLFTYNALHAIAMRGTADQIALAEWLFKELDKQPDAQQNQDTSIHEYRLPGNTEDIVRVFYLPGTDVVPRFQAFVTQVRTITEIRRLFTYNALRAFAARGTADQLALADKLIQERNK